MTSSSAGGQGGQGRGRGGAQGPGSHGQMAADLAQRMSDQARSAFQFSAQHQAQGARQLPYWPHTQYSASWLALAARVTYCYLSM